MNERDVLSGAYEHLLVEVRDRVAFLTLNRPERLNALNRRLTRELHEAVLRADADPDIGCIVVTGAGDRAFSAGGDLHEKRLTGPEDRAADEAQATGRYEIASCSTPTIAMVAGLAYGGAAVLASSLDLRVGCEHASFRFVAATLGRLNGTWTLPGVVGLPLAKELLFTARVVEAAEALRIGLLNRLVGCAELRSTTEELAGQIVANDPWSVQGAKQLLREGVGESVHQQWARERAYVTSRD